MEWREARTAGTLVATKNAMLESMMIVPQVTSATVGLRSNSRGHSERGNSDPSVVLLYTPRVSPAVPTMVIEERRARTVRPRPADSTIRDTPLCCGLATGVSNSWNSDCISGLLDVTDMAKYVWRI